MNKPFEKLSKEINFTITKGFEEVSLIKGVLLEGDVFDLEFHSKKTIPFEEMNTFLISLNKNFKYKSKFIFNIDSLTWEKENVTKYLIWVVSSFLGDKVLGKQISYSPVEIEKNNFTILINDPYVFNSVNKSKKDIDRIMGKLGWKNFNFNSKFEKYNFDETWHDYNKKIANEILSNYKNKETVVVKNNKKNFSYQAKSIPLFELEDCGLNKIITEGEIFDISVFKTKTEFTIYTFSITDYKSAVYLKGFAKSEKQHNQYLDFKIGDWVKVSGNYAIDSYSNEPTITITDINKMPKSKDKREDNFNLKRIELNTRSKMSTMDGIVSAKDLVKKAEEFGHEAIALLDQDNVQSFPEFYNAIKNSNVKGIYGATFSVIEKYQKLIDNAKDKDIKNETYVVFDLETTGLSPEFDEIIEFGAVLIKNGIIIEKKQFFIKPEFDIPEHIVNITNITNDMVKNSISQKEGLIQIKDFIKDYSIVAHNASFDVSFLRVGYKKFNIGKLENPIFDTLIISKFLNPSKKRFSLGNVCRFYKVEYDSKISHRADYDALVLSQVWLKQMKQLQEKEITNQKNLIKIEDVSLFEKSFNKEISIIAKNQEGLKDLFELISLSSTDRYFKGNKLFLQDINKRKNILIGSGSLKSRLLEKLFFGTKDEVIKEIEFYDYIEVQPPKNFEHLIKNKGVKKETILKGIEFIIKEAKKQNKLVVATGDVRYLEEKEKIYHEIYISAKGLGGVRHSLYDYKLGMAATFPTLQYLTTQEMLDQFDFLGNDLATEIVITNTNIIAKQIEEIKVIKEGLYTPKMEGSSTKLSELVYKNARKIYGQTLPNIIEDRIKAELEPIIKYGYDVIYWISHLLVKKSLDDGYIVGSRGSVGSSLVATFANISEVNPLPPHYICKKCKESEFFLESKLNSGYDLPDKECKKCNILFQKEGQKIPFETFLGFEANKVPDIDLNFSGEFQSKIHNKVKELFGEKNAFRAGTISTVAERTAFGYVKGWLEDTNKNASRAFIEFLTKGVAGTKRTTGQHPGGIIVVPKEFDVTDFTPINFPANDTSSSWKTTHFDFHAIHDNLLKLDLLGHDDPTAIRHLQKITGVSLDEISFCDKKVLSLFSSTEALGIKPEDILGETTGAMGIPEFGTKFVRGMLKKANVKSFGDLISISGLSHGTDVWTGNAEILVKTKKLELNDLVSCRDDIMTDLMEKGVDSLDSFRIMERVRKGKGLEEKDLAMLKEFKVEDWYIDSLEKIKYMFPKAHATAYVMMAWRIAWFKLYYPIEYYATYFSTRADFSDIITILSGHSAVKERINKLKTNRFKVGQNALSVKEQSLIPILELTLEAMARGIKFANIDLIRSQALEWTMEKETMTLIPPLVSIDGLGHSVANSVVDARTKKPFCSIDDIINRTSLNKNHIKILEELGAFKGFNKSNQIELNL